MGQLVELIAQITEFGAKRSIGGSRGPYKRR